MRVMMCGKQKADIKSFIQLCDMKLRVSSPLVARGGNNIGKFSVRHFSLGFDSFHSIPFSALQTLFWIALSHLLLSPIQFDDGFEFLNDTNQRR